MAERKSIPYKERKFDKLNKQNYDINYQREHYDRINFLMPKGYKDRIKEESQKLGMSVSEFLREAIDEKIDRC